MSQIKDEKSKLVAPCGINCGTCECYMSKDSPKLMEYLVSRGLNREKLPCPGCRFVEGNCPAIRITCATYTCFQVKGIEFCYECSNYPCSKLNPAADRAEILPHNSKAFNLSFIQHQGLEKFIEKSGEIKERYYRGKMEIGNGPQLPSNEEKGNG